MKKLLLTFAVLLGFLSARAATYTLTANSKDFEASDDNYYVYGAWTADGVSFDVNIYKNGSISNATLARAATFRWYQYQRLIIKAPEGELITGIEMTVGASNKLTAFKSLCGGEVTPAAAETVGNVIKWTNENGVSQFDAMPETSGNGYIATINVTTKPSNGVVTAPLVIGTGTKENPLTCADVNIMGKMAITGRLWIEGYIVGVYKSGPIYMIGQTSVNNTLLLADDPNETVGTNCISSYLSDATIKAEVNLLNNPENLGKKILFYAPLYAWYNVVGAYNPTQYEWVEEEEKPTIYNVSSVSEILELEDQSLLETSFDLTVGFVDGNNIYAVDAAGNFIKIESENTLKAGDVIPAGLTGTYIEGETPCITEATIPAATAGTFTPATVAAANVTTALVNNVIKIENVTFAEATPAAAENFTGTADGATLTFSNAYGLTSQNAGKYDLTAVVTIQNGAVILNVIDMEEVMNEAGNIAEIIALDNNSLLTTTFPLTVAYAKDGDAYVTDEAGDYILITGADNLTAGNIIPAGLVGKYTTTDGVPQIAATEIPAATEGCYEPATEEPENVTIEMVNHVFILNDVRFAEDTPSTAGDFSGTCGDIEFAFSNKYAVEGVDAGLYNVTVAVSILDNAPLLYVISYEEAPDNIRNAGDIASFIGNCTEENFPNVAINNPVVALYQNGENLYIKDESGYLLVYGDTKQTYTNGMIIPAGITGKAENNGGVYELSSPVAETFKAGEAGEIVMPEFIDYTEIATTPVNTYVYFTGLTFNQDLEGTWTLLAGSEALPMDNKFSLEFSEGGVATVSGFIGLNDGEAVFYPTSVEMDAPVPTPTFSVKAGNVEEGTVVEIECADPDATIYYNTDGSNTYHQIYTEPIVITKNTTIKAIAINHGERSLTARATYIVDGSEGIEAIDADSAPVEYYNLQGVRVANPENGIFIRRQGGKATKVVK